MGAKSAGATQSFIFGLLLGGKYRVERGDRGVLSLNFLSGQATIWPACAEMTAMSLASTAVSKAVRAVFRLVAKPERAVCSVKNMVVA